MSELRQDPISSRWVIIAKNRAERPHELLETEVARPPSGSCPFCEGEESQTPAEIAAYRTGTTMRDQPGWRVRVVPNKFPALATSATASPHVEGLHSSRGGFGAHEVIVESPRHLESVTDLSGEAVCEMLCMYRDRLLALRSDPRLVYGMIFKNVGAAAGASLEHTHSQLIGLPIVPTQVAEELAGSLAFYRSCGRCVFCDLIAQELSQEVRIVLRSPGFVAFCPYAARSPFETWIVPTAHDSHFETLASLAAVELGQMLRTVLAKIERALGRAAYNYFIHTAPFDTQALGHYHWHIEIIPRVTKIAGFEWGTGCYINPLPPEEAATVMRALGHAAEDA